MLWVGLNNRGALHPLFLIGILYQVVRVLSIPRRDNSGIFSRFFGMIYPWVQVIVGGTGVPLCGSFVVTQNVGDKVRVNVHVIAHHRWRFPELTQDPTDFGNLGSLIRQAFFHLACNFFCVTHSFLFVSHAPIISGRWHPVKVNQGFSLLPIVYYRHFSPPAATLSQIFSKLL